MESANQPSSESNDEPTETKLSKKAGTTIIVWFLVALLALAVSLFSAILHFDRREETTLFFAFIAGFAALVVFLLTGQIPSFSSSDNEATKKHLRSPFMWLIADYRRLGFAMVFAIVASAGTFFLMASHVKVVLTTQSQAGGIDISRQASGVTVPVGELTSKHPLECSLSRGTHKLVASADGFVKSNHNLVIPLTLPFATRYEEISLERVTLYQANTVALRNVEAKRLSRLAHPDRARSYSDWDKAFLDENRNLLLDIEQKINQAGNSAAPTVILVAAPAATGKGKLVRLIKNMFTPNAVKVNYDRNLARELGEDSVPHTSYLKIPSVAGWDFKLPNPTNPKKALERLLEAKGQYDSSHSLLLIDGLDEIHMDARKSILRTLASGDELLGGAFTPKCVVVFARAEGFLEFEKNKEQKYSNVVATTLKIPIPHGKAEFLAIWNDYEGFELRADDGNLKNRDFTELMVEKAKNSFVALCQKQPSVRETVSHIDMLNRVGQFVVQHHDDEIRMNEMWASMTDWLLERNKGSHGRPSRNDGGSWGDEYLQVLALIAAAKSSDLDGNGFFSVKNQEEIQVTLKVDTGDGTQQVNKFSLNVSEFLRHSGFVELDPLTFDDPQYRFVPIWMHRHLAGLAE